MPRFRTLAVGLLAIAAAMALYAVKHDTRRVEMSVQARERVLEKLEADIAILKSERAYLGRPERIEPLARAQGLSPIREQQYARVEEPAEDAIERLLAKPEPPPGSSSETTPELAAPQPPTGEGP